MRSRLFQAKRPTTWIATFTAVANLAQPARAQDTPPATSSTETIVIIRKKDSDRGKTPGRAASRLNRADMDERLPRSAPDALRYEPGVFVQQTAHGQASAYVRGRTGQETVALFDGIRLNTSTWRQGPNQYFFTVDSQTIHSIEVVRGGSSTLYGSDAIGGAIDARPMEPALDLTAPGIVVRPRATLRYSSADDAFGERFQVDTQASQNLRVLAGAGYRIVNRLESGGVVRGMGIG